jgi:hypothetical protein
MLLHIEIESNFQMTLIIRGIKGIITYFLDKSKFNNYCVRWYSVHNNEAIQASILAREPGDYPHLLGH